MFAMHCSLVVTCWERANLLALKFVIFNCVFVTFPCVVQGHVWYLNVSISDLCLLTYLLLKSFVNFEIILPVVV